MTTEHLRALGQPTARRLASLISERTEGFVFFVGAGPSSEAGLPTWAGLVEHLCREVLEGPVALQGSFSKPKFQNELIPLDNWNKIKYIKNLIGQPQYESSIFELLASQERPIPRPYADMWSLKPRGVITLNLDVYCDQAAGEVTKKTNVVTGFDAPARANILRSDTPFVIHAHGIIDQPRSWVLTRSDLERLLQDGGYIQFLRNLFSNFSIVFYGITPDDFSVSGELKYLREIGYQTPSHFWIVRDATDAHLSIGRDLGAQVISLDASRSWAESFHALVSDIISFKPAEPEPIPVFSSHTGHRHNYIDPIELLSKSTNDIREYLNSQRDTFFDAGVFNYRYYLEFCELYKKALRLATLVDYESGDEWWMGAKITTKLGGGVFGEVYGGELDGKPVALKVARDQVRRDRLMLNNFRRGVDSMKILSASNFEGVPKIVDVSELPPYIMMEFVNGKSLDQIIFEQLITDTIGKIRLVMRVAEIVNRCHRHPKMILHRDLRPSNVMISGDLWGDKSIDDVTVLDFDLSWHLGTSEEEYIMTNANALGYLAPEQIDPQSRFSARSALVDVYGCGMLLYFALAGRHPPSNASFVDNWHWEAYQHIRRSAVPLLASGAFALARIVDRATRRDQDSRMPLDIFVNQLSAIIRAAEGGIIDDQVIALDEIFYQFANHQYDYSAEQKRATYNSMSGLSLVGDVIEDKESIRFKLRVISDGMRHRGTLGKFLAEAGRYAEEKLRSIGVRDVSMDVRQGELFVTWTSRFSEPEGCRRHGAVYSDIMSHITSST